MPTQLFKNEQKSTPFTVIGSDSAIETKTNRPRDVNRKFNKNYQTTVAGIPIAKATHNICV